jgi:hypothetical protein
MTNLQRMLCGLFCVLIVQPASAELIKIEETHMTLLLAIHTSTTSCSAAMTF